MYIREKKTRTTPVLQLVSGARGHDGKVRQQIILSLGNLPIPDELRKTVAHEVENRMNGYQMLAQIVLQLSLFQAEPFLIVQAHGILMIFLKFEPPSPDLLLLYHGVLAWKM